LKAGGAELTMPRDRRLALRAAWRQQDIEPSHEAGARNKSLFASFSSEKEELFFF
jgi:hypothetical protein